MWPYEEYTLLENLLVIVIPYLFVMIVYLIIKPILFRKLSEKQSETEAREDEKDQEYW
jgi:flagellar biosynthesis/type III secretory pathway M-ring protein FliF/YscJ